MKRRRVQRVASCSVCRAYPWLSHELHTARTQGWCPSHCRALTPKHFFVSLHCHTGSYPRAGNGPRRWYAGGAFMGSVWISSLRLSVAPCCRSEARAEFLRVPQSSANCQSRQSKGAEWGSDEWSVSSRLRPSTNGGGHGARARALAVRRCTILSRRTPTSDADAQKNYTGVETTG